MRRRTFLMAAAFAAPERLRITSVKAAVVPFRPASAFGGKEFGSDDDPARHRWFGPFSQLTGSILVRIGTDAGITGWGLGGGGSAAIHVIGNHLRDLLIGSNALNVELLWRQMFDSSSFYGQKGLAVMAISGIDLALWDIRGQFHRKPVHELAGGLAQESVEAYYTGGNWRKGLELGFRHLKLPVSEGPVEGAEGMQRTLALLREVRRAAGPGARLMIDCLARWDVPYTLEFAKRASDLAIGLYWIEEPLYPYDIDGYRTLCEKVDGVHIASGEHEFTRYGFQELVRNKAADILQPDLTWSGGLSEGVEILKLGSAAGLPVIPHRGGSPYGLALVLTSKNCLLAESFGTGEDSPLWLAFASRYKDGRYFPNQEPGFGVHIDRALLKRFAPGLLAQ